MKAVVQRVSRARVVVEGAPVASIGRGLLLLAAVEREDGREELAWCAGKVVGLRIFEDDAGKMNRDLDQVGGELLAVSQFTLAASLRRGRRPSFQQAAPPDRAERLFAELVADLRRRGLRVATGLFGASMAVELVNDGPVTILIDSRERLEPRQG